MSDTSEFSFVVEKSSGETKSLEVIEEEQAAYTEPEPKATFDPVLVYGLVAISSVFAILGIVACVAVVISTNRTKRKETQVHAAPPADPKLLCMRAAEPAKIMVAERHSHKRKVLKQNNVAVSHNTSAFH